MYQLELYRQIQADRDRAMAKAIHHHRLLKGNDPVDAVDQPVVIRSADAPSAAAPSLATGCVPAGAASGPSRP